MCYDICMLKEVLVSAAMLMPSAAVDQQNTQAHPDAKLEAYVDPRVVFLEELTDGQLNTIIGRVVVHAASEHKPLNTDENGEPTDLCGIYLEASKTALEATNTIELYPSANLHCAVHELAHGIADKYGAEGLNDPDVVDLFERIECDMDILYRGYSCKSPDEMIADTIAALLLVKGMDTHMIINPDSRSAELRNLAVKMLVEVYPDVEWHKKIYIANLYGVDVNTYQELETTPRSPYSQRPTDDESFMIVALDPNGLPIYGQITEEGVRVSLPDAPQEILDELTEQGCVPTRAARTGATNGVVC
jgi:hypothetical protein